MVQQLVTILNTIKFRFRLASCWIYKAPRLHGRIYIYILKYSFKCKLLFVIKLTFLSQSVIEALSFYMSILKAIYFVEMVKSRYTYTTVHCFDFFYSPQL